ncbi:P-loop NTPase fold protein [Phenylobacterium sp.]|uniref:P-loop NTPase fold protein n=1 Tax=Phenylobacterium sp. TaxID=1871053 RepID=UPI0025D12A3C|nr:P-loop NTPase fold protein [Phenylobacterium sp.]
MRLFFSRLAGPRAWLELALLALSLLALAFVAAKLWFLATRLDAADAAGLLKTLLTDETKPLPGRQAQITGASLFEFMGSAGPWGLVAALGAGGLYKFQSFVKMPLSLKLEKYIATPDYAGHASFIESFHVDLGRLVAAYAGERRIFVFIDDLDRCDVPRAADLMQAINLMIGDSDNLIFVIGMDREKVAAGIAQKYKDMLPFLRESSHWKPNDEKDNFTPLYFGYAYLEKFVQISFSLPVAADEAALASFFRESPATPARRSWGGRLVAYWTPFAGALLRRVTMGTRTAGGAPTVAAPAPTQPTKRIFRRLEVKGESERIREVVKFVSALFEYNPRRIKQFINTFRLALYIASDQGLFDETEGGGSQATPEQIGKFVALMLRFPDLRFALEQDRELLGKMQAVALAAEPDPQHMLAFHWLRKPGTLQLLAHGCAGSLKSERYSLSAFDVGCLFSVLPRAVGPPDVDQISVAAFDVLGAKYEEIRRTERAGNPRTRKMAAVASEAMREAAALQSPQAVLTQLALRDEPGRRLMRIAIARAHPAASNLPWLTDLSANFRSWFEHYWCIQALQEHLSLMTDAQRARINKDLEANWARIAQDPGRIRLAERLRDATSGAPAPPVATKPELGKPADRADRLASSRSPRPAAKKTAASKPPPAPPAA